MDASFAPNPRTQPCPFGPALDRYWNRLSEQERRMSLDEQALYSLVIQESALATAKITPGEHVIDAFCGAGGSAIGFARCGKRVTAIELDPNRLEMAKTNAALFGVSERIEFLLGNSLELIAEIPADTVFVAPPWGGPSYSKVPLFTLDHFAPSGNVILPVALRAGKAVVLQLPKNFDLNELKRFELPFSVIEDRVNGELLSYTAVIPRT